jgi:hypothetical protein
MRKEYVLLQPDLIEAKRKRQEIGIERIEIRRIDLGLRF